MEEKKLTDEEIVKALELCIGEDCHCKDCAFHKVCVADGNDTQLLINALDLINRQKAEIERLTDEKEEIRLFNLAIQNGEIDMRIESEMAKSFYNSIIQIFEQNGAKNFFTTTVDIDGQNGRYAFTIEKVGGQTVADKIAELKAEIERLKIDLENERNWGKIQTKQAVKDTAREIFTDLLKEFSIRKSCGNADIVVREMATRKGVEVE